MPVKFPISACITTTVASVVRNKISYSPSVLCRLETYRPQLDGGHCLHHEITDVERGILDSNLLKTLLSCGLEFVAGNPAGERRQPCRLRSERKAKSCDNRIACKIHVRTVLVARLVITVLSEIFRLLLSPLRRMARELDAFIDRK